MRIEHFSFIFCWYSHSIWTGYAWVGYHLKLFSDILENYFKIFAHANHTYCCILNCWLLKNIESTELVITEKIRHFFLIKLNLIKFACHCIFERCVCVSGDDTGLTISIFQTLSFRDKIHNNSHKSVPNMVVFSFQTIRLSFHS